MESFLFYLLSVLSLGTGVCILFSRNPIYSALCLSANMICLAFLFFLLKSFFIGAVQLIVYAGAVMILFLMLVMLFDLSLDQKLFSSMKQLKYMLFIVAGIFTGIVGGLIYFFTYFSFPQKPAEISTKQISVDLFKEHLFSFELIGFLLLFIAVGVVTLSRIQKEKK